MNATDLIRQARTWEKAQQIALSLQTGAEYAAYQQVPGIYGIYKKSYSTAADTSYLVNMNLTTPTCTCPDFEKHGDYCKHVWAMQINLDEQAREEAQVAEYEAFQKLNELLGCL
jgi:uncharacterized Zn finger protein